MKKTISIIAILLILCGASTGLCQVIVGGKTQVNASTLNYHPDTYFQVNLGLVAGTLTNTYLCKYTTAGTVLSCDVNPATFQSANANLGYFAGLTGSAYGLPYFITSGSMGVLAKGTANQLFMMNSDASAFKWDSNLTGTFTFSDGATPGSIYFQEGQAGGSDKIRLSAPGEVAAPATVYLPGVAGTIPVITTSISDSDTTHSPDGNSIFDALALKAPLISPSFTTPSIGSATGTSLIVTGRLDGVAGVLETTADSATTIVVATHGSSSYIMNKGDSDAHSIITLPTAAAGLQYCARNYTGISRVLKFQTSAAGQYIDLDGTNSASGGLAKSAGAAGDAACVVGTDATHWVLYSSKGTWSLD